MVTDSSRCHVRGARVSRSSSAYLWVRLFSCANVQFTFFFWVLADGTPFIVPHINAWYTRRIQHVWQLRWSRDRVSTFPPFGLVLYPLTVVIQFTDVSQAFPTFVQSFRCSNLSLIAYTGHTLAFRVIKWEICEPMARKLTHLQIYLTITSHVIRIWLRAFLHGFAASLLISIFPKTTI